MVGQISIINRSRHSWNPHIITKTLIDSNGHLERILQSNLANWTPINENRFALIIAGMNIFGLVIPRE